MERDRQRDRPWSETDRKTDRGMRQKDRLWRETDRKTDRGERERDRQTVE